MTFGSLFAGIGGFDLGFERAGMACRWQVEINPFCRRVLAKHWPDVPRHDDVRTFPNGQEEAVDVVCGGFPCQDISVAGRGAGIDGERSGLWREYARVVRALRPRYVVVENSPALTGRGLGRVLGDLAACGYDAEWDCVPAVAFGAPHERYRIYVVAWDAHRVRLQDGAFRTGRNRAEADPGRGGRRRRVGAHADRQRREEQYVPALAARAGLAHRFFAGLDALGVGTNPESVERERRRGSAADREGEGVPDWPLASANGQRCQESGAGEAEQAGESGVTLPTGEFPGDGHFWAVEPGVGRVADGVPLRVDRLRGLGNAVVPQVAEWIGRRLVTLAGGKS